jgi:hypothetical protein
VGSTAMPLSKRLSIHKRDALRQTSRKVYEALNTVGWENVRIVQIEAFRCENKQELIAREQYYIDLLKPSMNKWSASGQKCIHDRLRWFCGECGGGHGSVCQHSLRRRHCKDCSPMDCDFCGIMTTKGNYDKHCQSDTHKRNESAEFLRVFGFDMND